MAMSHHEMVELEPIPFEDARQARLATPSLGFTASAPSRGVAWAPGNTLSLPWENEVRQEEQTTVMEVETSETWDAMPKYETHAGPLPTASTAPSTSHWTSNQTSALRIGIDRVDAVKVEAKEAKVPVKKRTSRSKKTVTLPVAESSNAEDLLAKRKSEIEKKSRQKRALNIGSMKDQVTRLEQNLLHLVRQQSEQGQQLRSFDPQIQLTLYGRLIQLREELAQQFGDSVKLRNEQVQLYQQLQLYTDINESLTNVISSFDFSDPAVYDLLARWTPPSDARCIELAEESMQKILSFKFTKRCSTDHHAGWQLTYEQSSQAGCQFAIDRKMSEIDVPALYQTIWDARATSAGANILAGMVCKAHISVLKTVSKDMIVVNRSLCFPEFTVRAVYLLFRKEVDGQLYIVSRELGSAQDLPMSQVMSGGTTQEQWVDVFSWSTFQKIPNDSSAVVGRATQSSKSSSAGDTYNVMYGGWWGSSFALTIRRWLLEMLFMVVRWENVHVQPRLLN